MGAPRGNKNAAGKRTGRGSHVRRNKTREAKKHKSFLSFKQQLTSMRKTGKRFSR